MVHIYTGEWQEGFDYDWTHEIWKCNEWSRDVTKYGYGNYEGKLDWLIKKGCIHFSIWNWMGGSKNKNRPYLNITYSKEGVK